MRIPPPLEVWIKKENKIRDRKNRIYCSTMRIQLPLEIWVDVFAPISRQYLAHRLNEIGSRSFAEIALFFLHEYGQIKLQRRISFERYYDQADLYNKTMDEFGWSSEDDIKWPMPEAETQMAEVPMPANIKDFQWIDICAQDDDINIQSLITFFTHLRPLLSNVNLWCNFDRFNFKYAYYKESNRVSYFLNRLLPLIDSFNSIHFYDEQCLDLMIYEKFVDKFFATKLVSIDYRIIKYQMKAHKIVFIHQLDQQNQIDNDNIAQNAVDNENENQIEHISKPKMAILRKWLLFDGNDAIIGNDGGNESDTIVNQPRMLYVDKIPLKMCHIEIDKIIEEFMECTKPTQFIACFTTEYENMDKEKQFRNFEAIRHLNQKTNEILSANYYVIGEDYRGQISLAVFLHSHSILADGDEKHEGNMPLINKIMETIFEGTMDGKYIYGKINRNINIYRKVLNGEDYCCSICAFTTYYDYLESENSEDADDFVWQQKDLRIEAFERRMKSRIKGKKKFKIKTFNGNDGGWWKECNKKAKKYGRNMMD